uniref:Peptidase S1 domain-containing protein n=1 Tax=Glossina pallidipes TaxID=7398 RepID=A0A1A9Z7U8_GLOPL
MAIKTSLTTNPKAAADGMLMILTGLKFHGVSTQCRLIDELLSKKLKDRGKGVVKVTWSDYSGVGTILSEHVILVHYAPDLTNAFENDKLRKVKKVGTIFCGSPAEGDYKKSCNQIRWRKAINFAGDKEPANNRPQIALIKLNREIDPAFTINKLIPLTKGDHQESKECVVVSLSKDKNKLVEIEATVVGYDECKNKAPALYQNATCVTLSSVNHCERLYGGEPLICGGKLTGVISSLSKADCKSDGPRICAKISKFRSWIQNTVKQPQFLRYPRKLSSPTDFHKNIAYLSWELNGKSIFSGVSVIIAKNILLTNHGENPNEKEEGGEGSAVYGINGRSPKQEYWNKAINYENISNPKRENVQLALLVLENLIDVDNIQTAVMPLPRVDPLQEGMCVVVGINSERVPTQTIANIVPEDECKKQIPTPYGNAICIDIPPDSAGVRTHCDLFSTGAALICNDMLAGVVSSSDDCDGAIPRLAANVYKYRAWIKSTMETYSFSNRFAKNKSANNSTD